MMSENIFTKKLRVLLILPPHHPTFIRFLPEFESYALLILGSVVEDLAEVKILDLRFEKDSAVEKMMKEFHPDIVGIRSHVTADIDPSLEVARLCRETAPNATIIMGGQGCALQPHDYNSPYLDLICMGQGDKTFREVVEAKLQGRSFDHIAGLCIVKNGGLHFTPLRKVSSGTISFPPLNRNLLAKYIPKYDAQLVLTTMGCPYRCKFCTLWVFQDGAYLLRDPEEIVRDIESCERHWVHFADDNTFHNYNHAMRIYELIKARGIKKRLTAYARTDTIVQYPDLFEKWASIGLEELVIGFEAFKEADLKSINKLNSADCNRKAQEILARCKINALAHFIVFPHYTRQDFKDLWNYIDQLNITDPILPCLTPIPGSIEFLEAKRNGQLSLCDPNWFNLEFMVYKTQLPKWQWYFEYFMVWLKSVSPVTFWKRHKAVGWPFSKYLERLIKLLYALSKWSICVSMQLSRERQIAKNKLRLKPYPTFEKDYVDPMLERAMKKMNEPERPAA
ncbi:MAG: cobalamin-dependent protein [Candidatus Omnitrophica bacterium]|nr:cobalamin-dependent protein [Candidatus Omnitrophota bacterium]